QWGVNNEKKAAKEYAKLKSKATSKNIEVKDCGLFIHPDKTWLGGSPDGVVKDVTTGETINLLEIKCPFKHRNNTVKEACKDKTFCLTEDEGTYKLKTNHEYFTQVQCQMAVTGHKKTDLVVYTEKELAMVPVDFDPNFWAQTLPKLEKFHDTALVPHLNRENSAWTT
uniref:YqaJ viral recombinase domain-containing protein n=2 Tax=Latimeria chalumnae TaxID=7897 RepID=H3AZD7_LATCH